MVKPVLRIRDIRYVSGFLDAYLWITDPDADPGGPKTYGSSGSGTLVHLHHSLKIKSHEKSLNSRNHGFSSICLKMEGSGVGSVLVTKESGCGSERPEKLPILRIRIRNSGSNGLAVLHVGPYLERFS
jgi:hypothetical protein